MMIRLICVLAALCPLAMAGCGGATAASESTSPTASSSELNEAELAKLDDGLREQLRHSDTTLFPVRVKFVSRPSRADLTDLFLVELDRDAVGRVDRPTLKAIASRDDVTHIVSVDAGYAEDDHEFVD